MRKLGIALALGAVACACKAGPEPVPAEASAPSTATAGDAPPSTGPAGPSATSPAPGAADPAPGAPRTYGEATKTVSAKVGERFSVALPSNLTLPFKWRLDPPDAKIVLFLEEKQQDEPPPGCADCVGYGGTRLYAFEAKGAGSATLGFSLKPLGSPAGPSQKDVTIAVTVSP